MLKNLAHKIESFFFPCQRHRDEMMVMHDLAVDEAKRAITRHQRAAAKVFHNMGNPQGKLGNG